MKLKLGIAVFFLFLFGLIFWWKQSGSELRIVAPKRGPIVEAVYSLGTVAAERTFQLKMGVSTSIDEMFVKEGDQVEAKARLAKMAGLPIFTAPFSGTITNAPFKKGEGIFPNIPVLTLVDLKHLYVTSSLEQQGALRVKKGQKVRLNFESLRGERLDGTVSAVYPSEGQFLVRIDAENFPEAILPGMTADLAIQVGEKSDALLLPVSALNVGSVIVLRDGKRKKIPVKVGTVDGVWAEIISGDIQMDDQVVIP